MENNNTETRKLFRYSWTDLQGDLQTGDVITVLPDSLIVKRDRDGEHEKVRIR